MTAWQQVLWNVWQKEDQVSQKSFDAFTIHKDMKARGLQAPLLRLPMLDVCPALTKALATQPLCSHCFLYHRLLQPLLSDPATTDALSHVS